MTRHTLGRSALIAAIALATPKLALADDANGETVPPSPILTQPTPTIPVAPANPSLSRRAERGRFSGRRMLVEILAGATVGTLVGYGVYNLAGGGDNIGAVFAGLGAEIAVTPLVVYGTGRAMGGQGTLGSAYYGGLAAFSGPAATPDQATLSFAVGMALMPITSALIYELSSHLRSKKLEAVANGFSIAPTTNGTGVGVRAGLSLRF